MKYAAGTVLTAVAACPQLTENATPTSSLDSCPQHNTACALLQPSRQLPVRARVLLGQGFWAGNFDDSGWATGNIFWEAKKTPRSGDAYMKEMKDLALLDHHTAGKCIKDYDICVGTTYTGSPNRYQAHGPSPRPRTWRKARGLQRNAQGGAG